MTINTQKLLAAHGSIAPLSPMRLERLEARALQQLDYSGPGSRGKSIYVGANEVLELVSAARALTDAQAVFDAQTAEMARLSVENDGLNAQADRHTAYTILHRGAALYCTSAVWDAYSDEHVRANAAEAEIARLRDAQAWQPIETAPHNETVLLGWRDWDDAWIEEVGMASWGWRNESVSNVSQHGRATHWMPLPAAPGALSGESNG